MPGFFCVGGKDIPGRKSIGSALFYAGRYGNNNYNLMKYRKMVNAGN